MREPPGPGYGNWVGGKVSFDPESGSFALFYRERRPLEAGRAGRCAVAISADGFVFEDVWEADKSDFAANSIEEGHCVRDGDGWRLYVSYEIAGTSTWRIDLIEAESPEMLSAQSRRTVLSPGDYGLSWIKDPFVIRDETGWRIYAAAPPRSGPVSEGSVVTAGPLDATVLTSSEDGRYFDRIQYVFEAPGGDSWHGRRARINSMFPWGDGLVAMYDGGRTFYDNYEEHAGIAYSADGVSFERLEVEVPWLTSPHGIVRYVSAVPVDDSIFFYYEYTREDGAHQLRVFRLAL